MAKPYLRFVWLLAGSTMALSAATADANVVKNPSETRVETARSAPSRVRKRRRKAKKAKNVIIVTGTLASLENAEREKRNSGVLIDGISADDIGALPDVSIADSLARIPGMAANDNEGGFDQASIRGLGPDLTQTTYNGRVLASPSPSDRRMPFGALPTEGISGAYVQKTPDAATQEGGLAGTVELHSINPLRTKRRGFTMVGRLIQNDITSNVGKAYQFNRLGYRAEAAYVGKLARNLGIALDYSHVSKTNILPSVQFTGYRTRKGDGSDLDGNNIPDAIPRQAGINILASTQNRDALIGTLAWRPVRGLRLTLDGLYVDNLGDENSTRFFGDNLTANGRSIPATSTVINDTVTALQGDNQAGLYHTIERDGTVRQRQFESGLDIAFDDGGPISFKVDGYYSSAIFNRQSRQVELENTAANAKAQAMPFGYDFTDPNHPTLNFEPLSASDYAVSNVDLGTDYSSDRIRGIGTQFTYHADGQWIRSLQVGMRFDSQTKERSPDDTVYSPKNFGSRPVLDSSYLYPDEFPFAALASRLGGESATSFPLYDVSKVTALINDPEFNRQTKSSNDVAGYYKIGEKTYAVFGQVNIRHESLSGNAGVRWFNTDETVHGFLGRNFSNSIPQTIKHTYSFLLPSLNLRYRFTRHLDARLALSKTISRPVFDDLKVGASVNLDSIASGNLTISRGNPDLKPFSSKNIDASIDWYPSQHMSFSAQGYFKAVTNFITSSTEDGTILLTDGTTVPVLIQSNANDPTVRHFYGVELIFRRDFDFLPGILSNTGLRMDYSHNWTNAIDTSNSVQVTADPGNTGAQANRGTVTVTPNNFTPDIFNAQLYYSTKTVDIRLAYRYYSSFFRKAFNSFQSHPSGQFDLSGSVKLWHGIRAIGSIRNLTKTSNIQYFPDFRSLDSSYLIRANQYNGRTITLGVRAHF